MKKKQQQHNLQIRNIEEPIYCTLENTFDKALI
jgi:hypothetical protein